jgi:hypothetical protein
MPEAERDAKDPEATCRLGHAKLNSLELLERTTAMAVRPIASECGQMSPLHQYAVELNGFSGHAARARLSPADAHRFDQA